MFIALLVHESPAMDSRGTDTTAPCKSCYGLFGMP